MNSIAALQSAITAATFAAVFVALYVAHSVGDHWVQSSCQAATKGQPGWTGRFACGRHVLGLTLTKLVVLLPVALVLDLPLTVLGTILGLGLDAVSHYWADRRTTLKRLADRVGKAEFYSLGTPAHPGHPTTANGEYAPTLGTGAYALDQSWHLLWLGVAALLIATV
ncbi:transcriptional regulator [Streptomyces sp. NPDC021012]|uniref:transcriptional regulator n=1 Tax=Streptomyces sp. NPDC021012 TaxID=3365107 RepID=UPI0037AF8884